LESAGFPLDGIGKVNPYQARYNAIYDSVSGEELAAALYHLVKRRGTVLDSPEDDDKNKNELSTKEQLKRNKRLLEGKFICEVQLERLQNKYEKMRNHENRFRTEDYVKEAKAILNQQQKFYPQISNEFINQYIDLIERRRQYYEGPGSEKSPTPYGSYYVDENGQLAYRSMIEKMRGKCTYFPEKYRMAKMSFTAELFNLLNDLNKIQIEGEYLTPEDKKYLVDHFIKKGKNVTLKQILKYKNVSEDADVRGYRVDLKTGNPLFTEFKGYKEINKVVDTNNLPKDLLDRIDVLDEIAEILTAEKSYTRREKQLGDLFTRYYSDPHIIEKMVNAFKELTTFTGYHALSKDAVMAILDDLWETNKNQMELFTEKGLEQKRFKQLAQRKNIEFDDRAILSTVAKRAHREAIKIVNEVRKRYGELDAIVVETAREKNSEEKRKMYADFQKQMGKFEKEMANLLGVKNLSELKLNAKQHLALKLWQSQDGKCIYSGKSISVNDIVDNPDLFEIDHIIPVSISFDDSQSNKVLCYHGENQKKGQRTPYQYFSSGRASRTFDQFKVDVLNLYKSKRINNKKKEYLLEMRDVKNNEELQKEFINRNLVDTQYAMRTFSMTLRTFFKTHGINTKVFSIKGSFTSALRRRAHINKDRDENYAHHAIDALIVAAIGKMPVFKFFKEFAIDDNGVIVNFDTGEILDENKFFDHAFINFIRNLKNVESKVKYSHKVDRKANRSMSNQTIYGTRKKDGEVFYLGRTPNLYQMDKKQADAVIKKIKKNPENFLLFQHNIDTFQLIQKIIDEYKNHDNPFKAFYDEHGYIMKDRKVPVKRLKYYDRKLGVHMKITDKYPNAKNDVVLLTIKGVRIDVYKNSDGHYKYLGVPYYWFKRQGNKYVLDMERYEAEKQQPYKNIDDSYEFQFSLYKNDRISYEKDGVYTERVFRGDNNPRQNIIEVDYIYKKKEERKEGLLTPSTIKNFYKYNVDVLGNTYKIEKENFKSTLQL
jgi:CRISPR-associated endonuclease Csn1